MNRHFYCKTIITGALFLLCLTGCAQKIPQPAPDVTNERSDSAPSEIRQDIQETEEPVQSTQEPVQSPQQTAPSNSEQIGEEQAKQIALEHAGVEEADTQRLRVEFDYDDGRAEYEVEWDVGQMEYDYEIDAYTGEILSFDKDLD